MTNVVSLTPFNAAARWIADLTDGLARMLSRSVAGASILLVVSLKGRNGVSYVSAMPLPSCGA
jgi:hypothetical protein